jgi:hypothetical protein
MEGSERRRWRSRMPLNLTGFSPADWLTRDRPYASLSRRPARRAPPRSQVQSAARTVRHSLRTATGRDAGLMPIRTPLHTGILTIGTAFQR